MDNHYQSNGSNDVYGKYMICDYSTDKGFWIGDRMIIEPDERYFLVSLRYLPAKVGEIDFLVFVKTHAPVDSTLLQEIFEPYLLRFASYITISFEDIILPLYRINAWAIVSDKHTRSSLTMHDIILHPRNKISSDDLRRKCAEYSRNEFSFTPEQRQRIHLATKRYMNAEQETDVIDRYCDLWEACEFLAMPDRNIKGGGIVNGRISHYLAKHTKQDHTKCQIVKVICTLYEIRKNIVHNAIEDREALEKAVNVLEHITKELLKYWMGLPYARSHRIDAYIRDCREAARPNTGAAS